MLQTNGRIIGNLVVIHPFAIRFELFANLFTLQIALCFHRAVVPLLDTNHTARVLRDLRLQIGIFLRDVPIPRFVARISRLWFIRFLFGHLETSSFRLLVVCVCLQIRLPIIITIAEAVFISNRLHLAISQHNVRIARLGRRRRLWLALLFLLVLVLLALLCVLFKLVILECIIFIFRIDQFLVLLLHLVLDDAGGELVGVGVSVVPSSTTVSLPLFVQYLADCTQASRVQNRRLFVVVVA
mmetsp:Transcript_47682/g.76449  ORF Transcript_47682/g.76449 Transcript_47682/m.76449 type:complete len:241 (+) Transcript_47682:162-884(+)